jgi:phage-related protein
VTKKNFEVLFEKSAVVFLETLDTRVRDKIIYNIDKACYIHDSNLFKKLTEEVWEFRTFYNKNYYRMFAFWDKSLTPMPKVIITHGIIKKTKRIPSTEITRATLSFKNFKNKKP